MISHALGDSDSAPMAPHLICIFLSGLAGSFSIYYRHRKILTVSCNVELKRNLSNEQFYLLGEPRTLVAILIRSYGVGKMPSDCVK